MKTINGREAILLTREEMIKDLEGHYKDPRKLNDEELEVYYNNEFYLGFQGKEYVLKKEKYKIIFRFSFLSCVLSDAKKGTLNNDLSYYLANSDFQKALLELNLNEIPEDYNGDNYDLIFDTNYKFIGAEKDLDISHALRG